MKTKIAFLLLFFPFNLLIADKDSYKMMEKAFERAAERRHDIYESMRDQMKDRGRSWGGEWKSSGSEWRSSGGWQPVEDGFNWGRAYTPSYGGYRSRGYNVTPQYQYISPSGGYYLVPGQGYFEEPDYYETAPQIVRPVQPVTYSPGYVDVTIPNVQGEYTLLVSGGNQATGEAPQKQYKIGENEFRLRVENIQDPAGKKMTYTLKFKRGTKDHVISIDLNVKPSELKRLDFTKYVGTEFDKVTDVFIDTILKPFYHTKTSAVLTNFKQHEQEIKKQTETIRNWEKTAVASLSFKRLSHSELDSVSKEIHSESERRLGPYSKLSELVIQERDRQLRHLEDQWRTFVKEYEARGERLAADSTWWEKEKTRFTVAGASLEKLGKGISLVTLDFPSVDNIVLNTRKLNYGVTLQNWWTGKNDKKNAELKEWETKYVTSPIEAIKNWQAGELSQLKSVDNVFLSKWLTHQINIENEKRTLVPNAIQKDIDILRKSVPDYLTELKNLYLEVYPDGTTTSFNKEKQTLCIAKTNERKSLEEGLEKTWKSDLEKDLERQGQDYVGIEKLQQIFKDSLLDGIPGDQYGFKKGVEAEKSILEQTTELRARFSDLIEKLKLESQAGKVETVAVRLKPSVDSYFKELSNRVENQRKKMNTIYLDEVQRRSSHTMAMFTVLMDKEIDKSGNTDWVAKIEKLNQDETKAQEQFKLKVASLLKEVEGITVSSIPELVKIESRKYPLPFRLPSSCEKFGLGLSVEGEQVVYAKERKDEALARVTGVIDVACAEDSILMLVKSAVLSKLVKMKLEMGGNVTDPAKIQTVNEGNWALLFRGDEVNFISGPVLQEGRWTRVWTEQNEYRLLLSGKDFVYTFELMANGRGFDNSVGNPPKPEAGLFELLGETK